MGFLTTVSVMQKGASSHFRLSSNRLRLKVIEDIFQTTTLSDFFGFASLCLLGRNFQFGDGFQCKFFKGETYDSELVDGYVLFEGRTGDQTITVQLELWGLINTACKLCKRFIHEYYGSHEPIGVDSAVVDVIEKRSLELLNEYAFQGRHRFQEIRFSVDDVIVPSLSSIVYVFPQHYPLVPQEQTIDTLEFLTRNLEAGLGRSYEKSADEIPHPLSIQAEIVETMRVGRLFGKPLPISFMKKGKLEDGCFFEWYSALLDYCGSPMNNPLSRNAQSVLKTPFAIDWFRSVRRLKIPIEVAISLMNRLEMIFEEGDIASKNRLNLEYGEYEYEIVIGWIEVDRRGYLRIQNRFLN
jgi:hypothetical protein